MPDVRMRMNPSPSIRSWFVGLQFPSGLQYSTFVLVSISTHTLTSFVGMFGTTALMNFSPVAGGPAPPLQLPANPQLPGERWSDHRSSTPSLQREPEAVAAVMGFKTISTTYLIDSLIPILDTLVRQILPVHWSGNSACIQTSALFSSLFCFRVHSWLPKCG